MAPAATAEALNPVEMTLEQWADMDEDEPGELVDGRIEEEEAPNNLHEFVVAWLVRVLGTWFAPRGGLVFGSEHKIGVAARRGRKPDVTVYAPGTRLRARDSLSRAVPLLVVEVVSPRPRDVRRDRIDKLRDYGAFGVRLYALLDPSVRVLEILELDASGRYTVALSASEGVVEVPGGEGLTLDLDALWAETSLLVDGESDVEPADDDR